MIMIWWIAKTTLTFEVETWLTPWMVEVSRNSFKTSIALTQPWPMTVVFVFLLCQTIHLIQPTFVNDKSSAFVFKKSTFSKHPLHSNHLVQRQANDLAAGAL